MPDDSTHEMSGDDFRAAVRKLGFAASEKANDEGLSACARFFDVLPRSVMRWTLEGPPAAIAICLRLMIALKIDAARAAELLAKRRR